MSQGTTATARPHESAFELETPEEAVPAKPGRRTDPVVRRLGIVALLIVVVWLSGVITALSTGLLTSSAPRTSVERALGVYEQDIAANAMTPEKWADYVGVLTAAGQYGKAQQIIETALEAVPGSASLIILEQARLDVAREDYDAALTSAEDAIATSREELAALQAEAAKKGVPFTQDHLEQEETAVLLMAEVYQATGDDVRAIEQYTAFLVFQPTAADVLVRRGDAKAATGDTAGAEADYRAALTYIPDDPAALAGLQKIGAEVQ